MSRSQNGLGLITNETDFKWVKTNYTWDITRRLPLTITKATGTAEERITSLQWHPTYRLPSLVSEPGRSTTYTYDSVGNALTQTVTDSASGVSRTTAWTYHASGLVATETAPNGAVTSYQYDSYGNLTKATNALGQGDTYTHDGAGWVLTHTAPTGLVTTYTYDLRGRLLTTSAGGLTTTLTYRPSGQVATVTTPYGHTTSYRYDAAQRLTGWSDNRGHSGNYVLDAMGNRLSEDIRDAQGQTAWKLAHTINSLNRVASTTVGSAGAPFTYGYDANGDLISATQTFNSAARTTQWQLDALRRVAATRSTEGATASVAYNALDNITQATDFKQVATNYTRDALGNAKAETSPDSGSQSATYDSLDLPQQVTDAMGRATTITRDALGRPTRLDYADGTATTLHYDLGGAPYNASGAPQASVGYLSEVRDPSATTSYQRDLLGRIVRKTQTLAGGNLQSVGYSYASAGSAGAGAGQLQSITYPSGKTLQYSYDATGQINAMHWAGQPLLGNIGWTPLGQPTGWQWNGFANTAGRSSTSEGTNATILTERRTYTDAGQLASSALLQLGWDGAGRVSTITQQHMLPGTASAGNAGGTAQPQAVTLSSTYSYDNAGRLITSAHSAPASLALPSGWSLSDTIGANSMGYAYDTNGNRTQAHYTLQTLAGTATEKRTEQTASGTNRLQSHSHVYTPAGSNASQTTTQDYPRDASGSLTRLGSQALQYNAQGRIAAATTAGGSTPAFSYQYNSSAQRLLKTDLRTSTTNTSTTATATTSTEATLYADDATGSTVLGQYSNQRSTTSAAPAGETDSTEVLWLPTANGPMPIGAQINGRLYAIDSDHLNTPRRLTNAQGQVVWQWLITGYGEVAPTTGATGYAFEAPQLGGSTNTSGTVYSEEVNFKLRYPGQVWDEETGLSYNLNRYYDGQAGRYVQSDPIGLEGGWNRFAYVGSDPLNFADDEGLQRRAGGPATLSWGQAQMNFQGVSLTNQIRQYQPNYSYSYASAPGQGFNATNIFQLQGTLQRLQAGSVCTPNTQTGQGYGVNDPAVRISGSWSNTDLISALKGMPPQGLGRPDLHHAGQMPGSAIHEVLPHLHRGNTALHPNRFNQGVTPGMRSQDRQLHWWYRAQEQGAFQRFPNLIYD
ncbi:MAG: RHS repeat-associated core domain-containing protein [Acidovorax sp.]|nr:RHS repeat-associated core domain-containing protein [Acidovorax sp.]